MDHHWIKKTQFSSAYQKVQHCNNHSKTFHNRLHVSFYYLQKFQRYLCHSQICTTKSNPEKWNILQMLWKTNKYKIRQLKNLGINFEMRFLALNWVFFESRRNYYSNIFCSLLDGQIVFTHQEPTFIHETHRKLWFNDRNEVLT